MVAGSPLGPLVLWFQLSRGASRGSERVMRFPQSTQGPRQNSNPGLSGPQAVLLAAVPRVPAPRQARPGVLEVEGAVRGRGWRPGEVAAPSPSRCCCCRRGGGWGTLCAMGVMAAVGYMAAETGSETGRRRV